MAKIKDFLSDVFLVRGFKLYKRLHFTSVKTSIIEVCQLLLIFCAGLLCFDYGVGIDICFAFFIGQIVALNEVLFAKDPLISSAKFVE